MSLQNDRVGVLLGGATRKRHDLVTPEGVALDVKIASNGERFAAFALDLLFLLATIVVLYLMLIPLFFVNIPFAISMTIIMFIAFIVRNMYFLHFELAWEGRTPGKKICGLRVINRYGGKLAPGAVIARNLTREVEVFLPMSLLFSIDGGGAVWQPLVLFLWSLTFAAMPLFNKAHLRVGDLIGGTQVISMPKQALLQDLSKNFQSTVKDTQSIETEILEGRFFVFSHEQLAVYGNFELQVLEEILRKPKDRDSERLLADVCEKIRLKIGWAEPIASSDVRRFLHDFYTAERGSLERGQLFGKIREDKHSSEV